MSMKWFNPYLGPALCGLMSLMVFLAYLPTFSGDFILDDRPLIKNNPYVRSFHSAVSYLSQEDGTSGWQGSGAKRTGYYRPLINFTYGLDQIFWGMKGPGFRASNVLFHLITCILFFYLIRRFTNSLETAFWIAALFALHPVNTEAVSWVSSRNNILVTLFGLASVYLHILGREQGQTRFALLSLLSFFAALLSKEFGIVLIFILFLWDRMVFKDRRRPLQEIVTYFPYVVLLCCYLLLRHGAAGFFPSLGEPEPFWKRLVFVPYLLQANTGLIVFPVNLHSFVISYPPHVLSWQGVSGVLFAAVLWYVYRREKGPVLRFSLLSYLCSLLPIVNLVPLSSSSLVSMRWLYFPMTFFLIGVSPYLRNLLRSRRSLILGILVPVVAYMGFLSHVLNRSHWHDEQTFFTQEVLRFGNDYYAGGLAEIFQERGEYDRAEKYFQIAITKGRATAKDMINYGALLTDTGRPRLAEGMLLKAWGLVQGYRDRAEMHNNLGTTSFLLNRKEEAVRHFRKAVVYDPGEVHFWSNLGAAYGSLGNHVHAVDAFLRGLERDPHSISIRKGLALSYLKMRKYREASSILEKIPPEKRYVDGDLARLLEESRAQLSRAEGSEHLEDP